MSQSGGTYWDGRGSQAAGWLRSEGREPGARRKKFAGYLKAANELRQSYQQSYVSSRGSNQQVDDIDDGTPGSFPDAAVIRSGDEEMILFPSYARRHVRRKSRNQSTAAQAISNQRQNAAETTGSGDAEFWREEWERYEDDHAVVDVDVRGWIYTPLKGPLNRKHRLFIGLARQLVGIAATPPGGGAAGKASPPESSQSSRTSSPGGRMTHRERIQARIAKQEEELVSMEAESIMRKGEAEAARAGKGEYSEMPNDDDDGLGSNDSSATEPRRLSRSSQIGRDLSPSRRREAWNQPANMSPAELQEANAHLMARLMPFLVNPLANTTISMFFYNEQDSRQKTVMTDAYGHFNVRAALEFVPTHVRVLASDRLSATEEIHIIDPKGVSLISDIDDTIKHTAINSGAREIFRNAFIRELEDLTIEGVQEWYNVLAKLGVRFHYVSNSPWQLYPILSKFFSLAGLPPGSFHLKQYSGMLQGIFEPVAERKKGTLDRIARDFPERRFILVGDSGEADLEVYTDFVMENPGRVLGVFIRDITTPLSKGFFDSSMGPLSGERSSGSRQGGRVASSYRGPMSKFRIPEEEEDDPELNAAIAASLHEFEEEERRRLSSSPSTYNTDAPENRPQLPPRGRTTPNVPKPSKSGPLMGKLIDFSDEEPSSAPATPPPTRPTLNDENRMASYMALKNISNGKKPGPPPVPPKKPAVLRAFPSDSLIISPTQPSLKKTPPPKPRRPSTSVAAGPYLESVSQSKPGVPPKAATDDDQQGYISSARQKISSVYNNLPSASSYWYGTSPTNSTAASRPQGSSASEARTKGGPPPPPPPRHTIASYPIAATGSRGRNIYHGSPTTSISPPPRYRTSSTEAAGGNGRLPQRNDSNVSAASNSSSAQAPNRREELWRRRWARAEQILGEKGVVLRSWRIGSDVMNECVKLVETALQDNQNLTADKGEKK